MFSSPFLPLKKSWGKMYHVIMHGLPNTQYTSLFKFFWSDILYFEVTSKFLDMRGKALPVPCQIKKLTVKISFQKKMDP